MSRYERRALEALPEALESLAGEIAEGEEEAPYFQESGSVRAYLLRLRRAVETAMEGREPFSSREWEDFTKIPFVVVSRHLRLLKTGLAARLVGCDDFSEEWLIAHYRLFAELENRIAAAYIRKELDTLEHHRDPRFEEHLLFNVHRPWLKKVVASIESGEMREFPIDDSYHEKFDTNLHYPEAMMVCMDARLCSYLHDTNDAVFRCAESFYHFYVNGETTQAYFMFKEMKENFFKYLSVLKELYHLSYSDLEGSFFRLVNMLGYGSKEQILTMVDIADLKRLNIVHGEGEMNRLLEEIEKELRRGVVDGFEETTLMVRGISANFYLLCVDADKEAFMARLREAVDGLSRRFEKGKSGEGIRLQVVTLALEKGFVHHADELIKILFHLKRRCKEEGGFVAVFDPDERKALRAWLKERCYNIAFVKRKMDERSVQIALQPIVESGEGRLVAYEVLARLEDRGKLIPATMFIDTLDELGRIVELDIAVLDSVARHLEPVLRRCDFVTLNASALSLADAAYQERLKALLRVCGPTKVMVEITERQALKNLGVIEKLHERLGVKFAIDDFGSGYTALKTVSNLAKAGVVEILKIDGSLVKQMRDDRYGGKLIEVIVSMCRVFSIRSLAEYVEDARTAALLRALGVDYQQGFHYSPPVSVLEARSLSRKLKADATF
ncbi:EAL domain-containing protein [Hydrogenimonas sp.]